MRVVTHAGLPVVDPVFSGPEGAFAFDDLPRGMFSVAAEHPELALVRRDNVRAGVLNLELRYAPAPGPKRPQ